MAAISRVLASLIGAAVTACVCGPVRCYREHSCNMGIVDNEKSFDVTNCHFSVTIQ
jgi:hypothetical protein